MNSETDTPNSYPRLDRGQNPKSELKDTRLIREITLKNILSFGPDTPPFELKPLNVLIGANGSGKSNLIDCIDLMRSTPNSFVTRINLNGVQSRWINNSGISDVIFIKLILRDRMSRDDVIHSVEFCIDDDDFYLLEEFVSHKIVDFDYTVTREQLEEQLKNTKLINEYLNMSMLERKNYAPAEVNIDIKAYAAINELTRSYSKMRLYRNWVFGVISPLRQLQTKGVLTPTVLGRLSDDISNIASFLQVLENNEETSNRINKGLSEFLGVEADYYFESISEHWLELRITEDRINIPATRLSDGTLRYLCLLAILCDPEPPPLICIEEPELGLHPDVLPGLADLLIEASTRTQLIVTTHSEILVDALNDTPESVVVCEKHNGATVMERLNPEQLKPYLEKYRLGELWLSGDFGGKRW